MAKYFSSPSVLVYCLQAFIIAFTSQFIDRLVYEWHYSDTGTLKGFVNFTLSQFSVSDFSSGSAPPADVIKPEHKGIRFCRYDYCSLLDDHHSVFTSVLLCIQCKSI